MRKDQAMRNGYRLPPRAAPGVAAALFAAGVSLAAAAPAAAQGCAVLVDRFAAEHSLSNTPPPTAAPAPPGMSGSTAGTPSAENGSAAGTASSDRLAQSGGVVAPPAVGDTAVIEPPAIGSNAMPTAPAVRPDAGPGAGAVTGNSVGQAAKDAQLEALVTAARTAADRGDEAQCMESLSQARRLSQSAPGGAGGGG